MACGTKILFLVQNKDTIWHQFFDQSTLEMVTYVFLPVECTKFVRTMQNQFLSSSPCY